MHLRPRFRRPTVKLPAPPVPVGVRVWAFAIRRRHWRVIVSHPHHYVTAAGLTAFLVGIGHFEAAAVAGAWGYALIENLATAAEGALSTDEVASLVKLVEDA